MASRWVLATAEGTLPNRVSARPAAPSDHLRMVRTSGYQTLPDGGLPSPDTGAFAPPFQAEYALRSSVWERWAGACVCGN